MTTRIHKLTRMHRKHWVKILGGLAILVGGGRRGYQTFIQNSSQSDEYISNDMVVGTGDIVNALTMNGRAKFSNMQKLTFPQSGRITAVYKKVGDIVKEGEIIAKMDTYEIDNELEQAKIDLENQQTSLKKAFDSSKRELEIMQAEKAYSTLLYGQKNADASLKLALQTIENTYINKKNEYLKMLRDYEKKQKDYETKQKTYNEIISLDKSATILHADEILKSKLEDLQFTADALRKEMDVLDKFMHYSDKYGRTQPEYLIYIGAKDASTKNAVETLFWKVLTAATNLSARAGSGQLSKLPEVELKSKLIQQYELLKETADIKTELSLMVDKMFEASIESVGTSRSAVSIGDGRTLKATAKTAIDEILGLASPETVGEKRKRELDDLKLEIETTKQTLDKLKIEYDQLDVEKAQKIADTKKEYEMKDLEVKIAKNTLDNLRNNENDDVRLIKNTIKQKEKQIATIMKKYDAYVIKANFDGVITKINLQLGDTVGNTNSSSTDEKSVFIENPDNLEIQLGIDQSDIIKLSTGMPVKISLDALPDAKYTGTLVEIDTTAGEETGYGGGGTNYKAKVVFTKKPEDTILGAMTATVTIVLEEAHEVMMVPNIAISTTEDGPVVMKIENGKYKKTPITVGISDQANTEVLSGLTLGDTIMGVFIDPQGIASAGLNDKPSSEFENLLTE